MIRTEHDCLIPFEPVSYNESILSTLQSTADLTICDDLIRIDWLNSFPKGWIDVVMINGRYLPEYGEEPVGDPHEIGNFANWLPIYKDKEGDSILMNLNQRSDLYRRVLIAFSDNHGRMSYTLWAGDLQSLLQALAKYPYPKDDDNKFGWEVWEARPIVMLLKKMNIPIYYG